MKLITQLIIIILLTFTVVPDKAIAETGNELLEMCDIELTKDSSVSEFQDTAFCHGYIVGAYEGMKYMAKQKVWCRPEGVTFGQIKKVVIKYLKENPQRLHELYVELVLSAMREAFPCKSDFNN